MKKFLKLLFVAVLFTLNIETTKAAEYTEAEKERVHTVLQNKLDKMFSDKKITINVSKEFMLERYNSLSEEDRMGLEYSEWVKGPILDLISSFGKSYFKDNSKIDTGIVYEGKKIYADGFLSYGNPMEGIDAYAVYYYEVYNEWVPDYGYKYYGDSVTVPLSVNINYVDAKSKIYDKISTYKTKINELKVLKYDDLNWINMLLATNLNGIFNEQVINSNSAKYLLAPITGMDSDIEMMIDNRRGAVSFVGDNESDYSGQGVTEVLFGGEFPIFYNNTLYDNVTMSEFDIYYGNSINIPKDTEPNKYIETVEKRISDYINNKAYEVTVTKTDYNTDENLFEAIDEEYVPEDNKDIYKLNIKYNNENHEYFFVIKLVSASAIKVPEVNYLDDNSKIFMSTTSSDIPSNSIIKVDVIEENTARQKQINSLLKTDKTISFDISLEGANGVIKQVNNGFVTIKIPVPEEFDVKETNVFFVSGDGCEKELIESNIEMISGKKYAVFFTNHFSTYTLAETKDVKNPQTGDNINNIIILGFSSLLLIIVTKIVYDRKNYLSK